MALEHLNPSRLDRIGTIATGTGVNVGGEISLEYTATYENVRAKKLNPLRSGGGEELEVRQDVATQEVSWQIRREDRVLDAKHKIFIVDGMTFSITQVRDYKGSRNWLVLDTIWKDNFNVEL